jgi:hypothetical protein
MMAKQTFTTGQVLTAAQMTSLQQTAMLGGAANAKVASYVLVAADAGDAITMSNASATTITVNTGLFAAGDIVTIINLGAGVCTITAGTATVTTSGSLALAQNQGGVLRFTSASAAIFFQFATPASGDIEGVTAGTGISGGGTSGTVTITNSMATEITAKGDLIVGTGNATFDNLPVGTNGYTLVADSVEATGLKWAAPSASSGPAFRAFRNTSVQNVTGDTFTKVELNAETFDTASCFDSTTNYRFTPNVAGYYKFTGSVDGEVQVSSSTYGRAAIYKNGSVAALGVKVPGFQDEFLSQVSDLIYMNGTTDYVELFGYIRAGSVNENIINGTTITYFEGVWIRS